MIFVAFRTGFGGTLGFEPILEAFTAPLIGAVCCIAVRLIRRARGMSSGHQTFTESPPE